MKYRVRFFLEWGGGCLWPADAAARDSLGVGPLDLRSWEAAPRLPLPEDMQQACDALVAEHDSYLNPLYPPDPSLWSQAQCDSFNARVDAFVAALRQAMPGVEIIDQQTRYAEDPGLDAWLAANPGYTRIEPGDQAS